MLTITITDSFTPIAHITIHNDGTGTRELGNYDVTFKPGSGHINDSRSQVTIQCRVEGYDRSKGWLPLLLHALDVISPMAKALRSFGVEEGG